MLKEARFSLSFGRDSSWNTDQRWSCNQTFSAEKSDLFVIAIRKNIAQMKAFKVTKISGIHKTIWGFIFNWQKSYRKNVQDNKQKFSLIQTCLLKAEKRVKKLLRYWVLQKNWRLTCNRHWKKVSRTCIRKNCHWGTMHICSQENRTNAWDGRKKLSFGTIFCILSIKCLCPSIA